MRSKITKFHGAKNKKKIMLKNVDFTGEKGSERFSSNSNLRSLFTDFF